MTNQIPVVDRPEFKDFLLNDEKVFIVKGSAGTGKTTQIKQIIKNPNTFVVTYTNKAAAVLRKKEIRARTIHGAFYQAIKTDRVTKVQKPKLDPKTNKQLRDASGRLMYIIIEEPVYNFIFTSAALKKNKVIDVGLDVNDSVCIVDEGSLVPCTQWYEIFTHFPGKIIIFGDDKQLDPVEVEYDNMQAAGEDVSHLTPYKGLFSDVYPNIRLNKIYRQKAGSAIHTVVSSMMANEGNYPLPLSDVDEDGDGSICRKVTSLTDVLFLDYLLAADIVITWQKVSCSWINSYIRSQLFAHLFVQEPTERNVLPREGDKLYVEATYKDTEASVLIFKGTDLVIRFLDDDNIDYKNGLVNGVVVRDGDGNEYVVSIRLDFVGYKKKNNVKALKVDYGYAITCHKAQGSEYSSVVVVDDLYCNREKWVYTAATRAKQLLVMFKFPGFANIVKAEIKK